MNAVGVIIGVVVVCASGIVCVCALFSRKSEED